MSSKTVNIYNFVSSTLKTAQAGGTLNYVAEILDGWRKRDDIAKFPVIVLEPTNEPEKRHTVPNGIEIEFKIMIVPFMEVLNPKNQITGDNGGKGILDIIADIKNVLSIDKSLGGLTSKVEFPDCNYYFEQFPYRYAELVLTTTFNLQDQNR